VDKKCFGHHKCQTSVYSSPVGLTGQFFIGFHLLLHISATVKHFCVLVFIYFDLVAVYSCRFLQYFIAVGCVVMLHSECGITSGH